MNYTELKTQVADFAHRSDLTAKMDIFTELAEAAINKDLRCIEMEKRDTTNYTAAHTALPTDYIEMRAFSMDISGARVPLPQVSPQVLDNRYSRSTSSPRAIAIHGGEIEIRPAPSASSAYDGEMSYYARVPTLVSNANNDILTNYPLIYLSAMMVQVYLYLQDAEEKQGWIDIFNSQIDAANKAGQSGRYTLPTVQVC